MDSIFDNCKSMSISPLKEEKKIGKELVTNNKTIKAILSLILYNQSFINKIQSSIKEGEINKGYLIKYDFMNDIFKLDIYKIIFDYICNNQNIQKLLPKLLYNDYNIFYEKILKEFDAETINKINKYNKENNIYSNQYDANIKNLKLNNNIFSYITNNFFILNEELYKLFSSSKDLFYIENNFEYFYKEKKIFIKLDKLRNKNSLLICYINNRNELILEEIFYFFNSKNRENCIEQIKEEGLSKYQGYLLFNEGDLFSPIFDKNQNYIGNAYKYDPLINDYTKYNINFEIRKMILLYLNYKKLRNPNGSNNNKFKEYYLINESWMDNYKDYYKFNEISYEFDKNSSIQTIINSIINTDKNNNFNLKDKLVALIIKLLPKKIIHDFNIRDREFNYKFNNEEIQNPNTILMNYNVNNILFYYSDFELVNAKIYDSLFKYMNMNILIEEGKGVVNNDNFVMKAEKVECIFEAELIIIQFPNKNTEGKYLIEIGELNNNNIFEPEYFLLYDQYNYLNEHVQNIISSYGFKEYCKTFSELPLNTMEIIDNNNIKIGIAIKKNMNPEYDKNNVLNIMNQQYSTNIQQDKIKNENTKCIKEGQINKNKNNMIANDTQSSPKLNRIFLFPPRVGLDNIGATCYMNATLQCFCQIEEFASYFKYDKYINEVIDKYTKDKKDSLTTSFKILVEKIWPNEAMYNISTKRHFPPKEFRQKIEDMSPLFKNIGANDAKDLVNFIIMTLHEELNQSIVGNNFVPQNNPKCGNQIEYLFQIFYQDYQRTFRSKISELFFAIQQTQTKCLNCNNEQYNFQAYFFLSFPLEEVRKHAINKISQNNMNQIMINMNNFNMKNPNFNQMQMNNKGMRFNPQFNNQNNMMNFNNIFGFSYNNIYNFNNNALFKMNNFPSMNQNMQFNNMNNMNVSINNNNNQYMAKLMNLNNNIVTLMDCFNYNQKIDKFEGSNQIYCSNCKIMANTNYCTYLTTAPKILILLLNRGTGIQFKVKLEFTEFLDISNYVSQNNGNDVNYQLIGVVTHFEENGKDGHFIAHCLSPIDNEWYTYDDAIVSKIEKVQFQEKVINLGNPYILFYKRLD